MSNEGRVLLENLPIAFVADNASVCKDYTCASDQGSNEYSSVITPENHDDAHNFTAALTDDEEGTPIAVLPTNRLGCVRRFYFLVLRVIHLSRRSSHHLGNISASAKSENEEVYVTTRFTVDGTDPFSMFFFLIGSSIPVFMIVVLTRVVPMIISLLLIWWLVRVERGEVAEPRWKMYEYHLEEPEIYVMVLVYTALFGPRMLQLSTPLRQFREVLSFRRACENYKSKIWLAGFFCFFVDLLLCPILAITNSFVIAFFLHGGSLLDILLNALVMDIMNDLDVRIIDDFLESSWPDSSIAVSILRLRFPPCTVREIRDFAGLKTLSEYMHDDEFMHKRACYLAKHPDLVDQDVYDGFMDVRRSRVYSGRVSERERGMSHDDRYQLLRSWWKTKECESKKFWRASDLTEEMVLAALRRESGPTEKMTRLWNILRDDTRGLGISRGSTCSIHVSVFSWESMKPRNRMGRHFLSVTTDTEWREGLTNAQRNELICSFPVQACRFPVFGTSLDLTEHKGTTDEDAKALSTIILENKHLVALKFGFNNLHHTSAQRIVVDALKTCKDLSELTVTEENQRYMWWKKLLELYECNPNLKVKLGAGAADVVDMFALWFIARENRVDGTAFKIELRQRHIGFLVIEVIVEVIERNKVLDVLDLRDCQIHGDAFAALAGALKKNETLSTLAVPENSLETVGAQALGDMLKVNTSLKVLDVSRSEIYGDAFRSLTNALRINTTLMELNVAGNSLATCGTKALAEMLRVNGSLKVVNIADNEINGDAFRELADALMENETLAVLNVEQNSLGTSGAQALGELLKVNTYLKVINVAQNRIGVRAFRILMDALMKNNTLTELNMRQNAYGPFVAKALGDLLKVNTSLTMVNIADSEIVGDACRALADALIENETLTELNMSGNSLGLQGAHAMGNMLKVNKSLTKVNIGWGKLDGDTFRVLAQDLKENSTLTDLNMGWNFLHDMGTQVLGDLLKVNKSLKVLNLVDNEIDGKAFQALADALIENTTLEELNMMSNSLGAAGTNALAEMLRLNTSLKVLNVGHNEIDTDAFQTLAYALMENVTLTELSVAGNSLWTRGVKMLGTMLKVNQSLKVVNIKWNDITGDAFRALTDVLQTNKTLVALDVWDNDLSEQDVQAVTIALIGRYPPLHIRHPRRPAGQERKRKPMGHLA
eukprot:GEMP01004253.1.p1 GENE.GEMP01004253.1~~GEMP01004253.1.p1  ORF type:complete len:1175 (+),score=255.45 GEMP01004253.1:582-4106(+)